jgi:hypothetical protein
MLRPIQMIFPLLMLPTIAGCGGNVVVDGQESSASVSSSGGSVGEPDAPAFCEGFCKIVHDSDDGACGEHGLCFSGCVSDIEKAAEVGCLRETIAKYRCWAIAYGPEHECRSSKCEAEWDAASDCKDAAGPDDN